jgi:hypothetical protein
MKRCKSTWERSFYCAECQRTHGANVFRFGQFNGDTLCSRGDDRRHARNTHNQGGGA